ncbi:MAG: OmpA family protein [Saprospiraceae bacterium]|nr:OmpA family protein [Saprospiraceae bacterium]
MSKLLPLLAGAACFLWVSGWTWMLSDGKQSAANASQSSINIFVDSVRYKVQHPFAFEYSDATPVVAENLLPAIKSVAKKLDSDKKANLKVIGVYSPMEDNETSFPNLGIARAEAVKSMLESSGASPDVISTVGLESANLFQMDGKLTGAIYFSFSNPTAEELHATEVKGEDEVDESELEEYSEAESFYYKYGDYKVVKSHVPYLKRLAKLLKDQPKSKVVLTGYSGHEEEAASDRINLAEMRAMSIRRYLVDQGVRRAQIEVKAKPAMSQNGKEMIVAIQIGQE